MVSKRIDFDKLNNTRDMGGMIVGEGRVIKEGLLFRSGFPKAASPADIKLLQKLGISIILDLRSPVEFVENPDPEIEGIENLNLPLNYHAAVGIAHDKKTEKKTAALLKDVILEDRNAAINMMSGQYRNYVVVEYTRNQMKEFLNILLENEKGGVLWHCAGGKDRTGILAVLLLEIFGASHEDIIEDYLYTNVCKHDEVETELARLKRELPPEESYEAHKLITEHTWYARQEYIDMFYNTVAEEYGTIQRFIDEGVGVTEEMKQALKAKFLK